MMYRGSDVPIDLSELTGQFVVSIVYSPVFHSFTIDTFNNSYIIRHNWVGHEYIEFEGITGVLESLYNRKLLLVEKDSAIVSKDDCTGRVIKRITITFSTTAGEVILSWLGTTSWNPDALDMELYKNPIRIVD